MKINDEMTRYFGQTHKLTHREHYILLHSTTQHFVLNICPVDLKNCY